MAYSRQNFHVLTETKQKSQWGQVLRSWPSPRLNVSPVSLPLPSLLNCLPHTRSQPKHHIFQSLIALTHAEQTHLCFGHHQSIYMLLSHPRCLVAQ